MNLGLKITRYIILVASLDYCHCDVIHEGEKKNGVRGEVEIGKKFQSHSRRSFTFPSSSTHNRNYGKSLRRNNDGSKDALTLSSDAKTSDNVSWKNENNNGNGHGNGNDSAQRTDGKMRVLFYPDGCSGSSVTWRVAKDIIKAHGFNVWNGDPEQHKAGKNTFFKLAKHNLQSNGAQEWNHNDVMLESYKLQNDYHLKNGEIFFVKALYDDMSYLERLDNFLYTSVLRKNKLDQFLCRVRDCFEPTYGYPVLAINGTKTNLCFKRRQSPSLEVKAHVHVDKLQEYLHFRQKSDYKHREENNGNTVQISDAQYYEDLFAFTSSSDPDVFQASVKSWHKLLWRLLNVDHNILINVLLPLKNTRKPPSAHVRLIHNFDEVKDALEKSEPALDHYLRME